MATADDEAAEDRRTMARVARRLQETSGRWRTEAEVDFALGIDPEELAATRDQLLIELGVDSAAE